jgi:hypothetical protein
MPELEEARCLARDASLRQRLRLWERPRRRGGAAARRRRIEAKLLADVVRGVHLGDFVVSHREDVFDVLAYQLPSSGSSGYTDR